VEGLQGLDSLIIEVITRPRDLGGAKVSLNGGIQVDTGENRFVLDPKGAVRSNYTFVSHAHIDHMHNPARSEKVIASKETADLAKARGYDLGQTTEEVEGVELLDSGHILGSRAIRIADEVFYTGDASGRERAFLGKCRTRRARILIMETTYGSPEYVFPQTAKLVRDVNGLIGSAFDHGRPVILMGYPLGKAQLLAYYFSTWEPLFFHASVAAMNKIHLDYGIPLKTGRRFDPSSDLDSLPGGPWVMVAPMSSSRNRLMSHLRKKHDAILVAFSGWAIGGGYGRSLGADYSFPLSDHCDYPELVKLVEAVSPETVFTTHGFAAEFASDLRRIGFSARALSAYQSSLSDYVKSG
jgi:putative mRNA 3-end processing factor